MIHIRHARTPCRVSARTEGEQSHGQLNNRMADPLSIQGVYCYLVAGLCVACTVGENRGDPH